jgi:hypothetical protein
METQLIEVRGDVKLSFASRGGKETVRSRAKSVYRD